jgi:hypothetical protein
MAKIGVSLKIDVTKIEKARLFKGEKGTYLDATAFIDLDELDQYGDSGMIAQSVSKEERENKIMGNILGNSKVFYSEKGSAPSNNSQQPTQKKGQNPEPIDDFDDSIPF